MDIVTFILLALTYIALSTFTFNLKAAKLSTDCYYPDRNIIKLIYSYDVNATKLIALRCEIADAIGVKLDKKDKKMNWFIRLIIGLYQPLFKRIGLEQTSVDNWFINTDGPGRKDVTLRMRQLKEHYQFVSDLADVEINGQPHTELEKLYLMYWIIYNTSRSLGVTDFETIVNKPVLDKMFSGVDKDRFISKGVKASIVYSVKLAKDTRKVAKTRYEVSLLLKMIPFLHPNFKTSPKYKLFINN